MIRVFDAFSGIGGFRSALERVGGFEIVGWCEIDRFAQKAYKALYDTGGEQFYENIRDIDVGKLADFDLLIGGFPCQPFSVCGARKGFADERGDLFFELARLLEAKRPKYFCFENVPGLMGIDSGKTFAKIIETLSQLGYCVEWRVYNSADYLPQVRKRVYIAGCLGIDCSGKILAFGKSDSQNCRKTEQIIGGSQGTRVYDPDGLELSPEEEEAIMQEKWDNGEFDDIREEINEALMESSSYDSEDIAEEVHKYLSPIDVIPKKENKTEKHILTGEFKMEPMQHDMRNALYITAYELLEDYDSMLQKAKEMQASSIVANQYSGIYYELKVGKYTNKENWQKKYRERINFWTKRMLEDPTDFISASYRIRSYIDIGDYENAEQLCACLPTDAKEPLMDEIRKAKTQGGGEDVNPH